MQRKFTHIAVLMGGDSSEREVSLKSGRAVSGGLREVGYRVTDILLHGRDLRIPEGIEAVFIALHGAYGEDGGVQAELDRLGIPYTGSGAEASRAAFDKCRTRSILAQHGIPTPPGEILREGQTVSTLQPPVVVKPPREGSSVGVQWVDASSQWDAALAKARVHSAELLVERYIPGREWTAGMVAGRRLPLIEILAPGGRYDPDAKYLAGRTRYAVVDETREPAAAACARLAMATFEALGARGLGRVDFRLSPEGHLYVLELNSIPGFTPTSLLPKAALAAGIGFAALCAQIMETARCDATPAGAGGKACPTGAWQAPRDPAQGKL